MKTREILKDLGFAEDWNAMTDRLPAYRYKCGNLLQLTAAQGTTMYLQPTMYFAGIYNDGRTMSEIAFEMPLDVESFEQGVAWIAYGIHEPKLEQYVPWIKQGLTWANTLPWVRQLKEYEARPQCSVERDWLRVAVKRLRELADKADEHDLATFSFDGEILRIAAGGAVVAVPASGEAWERASSVQTKHLSFLLKRLMQDPIEVSVWEGKLRVGNRVCTVAEPDASAVNNSYKGESPS